MGSGLHHGRNQSRKRSRDRVTNHGGASPLHKKGMEMLGDYYNGEFVEYCEHDVVIQPNGDIYSDGKLITHANDDWDLDREAIEEWMQVNQFWPNVWMLSDHGNLHLITDLTD